MTIVRTVVLSTASWNCCSVVRQWGRRQHLFSIRVGIGWQCPQWHHEGALVGAPEGPGSCFSNVFISSSHCNCSHRAAFPVIKFFKALCFLEPFQSTNLQCLSNWWSHSSTSWSPPPNAGGLIPLLFSSPSAFDRHACKFCTYSCLSKSQDHGSHYSPNF